MCHISQTYQEKGPLVLTLAATFDFGSLSMRSSFLRTSFPPLALARSWSPRFGRSDICYLEEEGRARTGPPVCFQRFTWQRRQQDVPNVIEAFWSRSWLRAPEAWTLRSGSTAHGLAPGTGRVRRRSPAGAGRTIPRLPRSSLGFLKLLREQGMMRALCATHTHTHTHTHTRARARARLCLCLCSYQFLDVSTCSTYCVSTRIHTYGCVITSAYPHV